MLEGGQAFLSGLNLIRRYAEWAGEGSRLEGCRTFEKRGPPVKKGGGSRARENITIKNKKATTLTELDLLYLEPVRIQRKRIQKF